MHSTPHSLLQRLRRPGEEEAWKRFTDLYTPLLYYWSRGLGLQQEDAADLVQEVFAVLIRKLPEFKYDQQKSFRCWLHALTVNKCRDLQRRRKETVLPAENPAFSGLAAPDGAEAFGEAEYRQLLIHRAVQIMRKDFQPATWKACWEYVVMGRPATEVAAELGISVATVYVAKSRVLSRLREELEGLLD